MREQLDNYIEEVKSATGCPDVHLLQSNGKFRFQLEVPDRYKLDPDEYIASSKAKGKQRYVTETIEQLTEELEAAEEVLKEALVPFLRTMFRRFYQYRSIFSNAVACISELDCLCALADVSADDSSGPMCKPVLLDDGEPVLELTQMRHPCVQMIMKDSSTRKFIPNDLTLGNPNTLLITGPNMGGKSTLLR